MLTSIYILKLTDGTYEVSTDKLVPMRDDVVDVMSFVKSDFDIGTLRKYENALEVIANPLDPEGFPLPLNHPDAAVKLSEFARETLGRGDSRFDY